MFRWLSTIKNSLLPIILIGIAGVLVMQNYISGSVLSGWDTLQPELNLPLYLERIFWGVWQQHQGLGAVAAQAQASELGRLWYLIPASLLPTELFRYGYFWLMLAIGPLGVYLLLRRVVSVEAAFVGGLFYLLNLGTMQHFLLPLEMFATAYAFLPWLFLAVYQRRIKLLALLFFLSAPMAHTPTLWFINFGALILFAGFLSRRWALKVGLLGIVINIFWLLPSLYFVFNHGADVAVSHISEQFSNRAIATSREFATVADLALAKGYLFDWGHFDFGAQKFAQLLVVWKEHLGNVWVALIGYGTFIAALSGLVVALKERIDLGKAMLLVVLVGILGMLSVFDYLGILSPTLAESLRFPFTKFSLLLMLPMAVFLGIAAEQVKRIWVVISVLLIIYMWPAFTGNFICSCVRVDIPGQYKELFSWFSAQDPGSRIAPFPVDSIYGWAYYDFGYEGAGFRWFGLPQPILDREFDRWMPTNENYYWEISYALYSKNLPLFENVLEKYRVNWLLVDGNVINPSSPKSLYLDELGTLVKQSKKVTLSRTFNPTSPTTSQSGLRGVNKIEIYRVALDSPTKDFVSVAGGLPEVGPAYRWGNLDQGYADVGDYISQGFRVPFGFAQGKQGSLRLRSGQAGFREDYQYRTLFTGRGQADLEFDPQSLVRLQNGQMITIDPTENGEVSVAKNCNNLDQGKVGNEVVQDDSLSLRTLRIYAKNATNCSAQFSLPTLSHAVGYFITVENRNITGKPLLFWIENMNSRRADLETYLPSEKQMARSTWRVVSEKTTSDELLATSYFVQPPMETDGLGYTLHFDGVSIGDEESVNDLGKITVTPIDYWGLVGERVQGSGFRVQGRYVADFQVEHPNASFYRVDLPTTNSQLPTTVILSQSFEPGWVAIGVDSNQQVSRIGGHKLVNNWANGWEVPADTQIVYLFFWPQLLEFLGMGIGALGVGFILVQGLRRK